MGLSERLEGDIGSLAASFFDKPTDAQRHAARLSSAISLKRIADRLAAMHEIVAALDGNNALRAIADALEEANKFDAEHAHGESTWDAKIGAHRPAAEHAHHSEPPDAPRPWLKPDDYQALHRYAFSDPIEVRWHPPARLHFGTNTMGPEIERMPLGDAIEWSTFGHDKPGPWEAKSRTLKASIAEWRPL